MSEANKSGKYSYQPKPLEKVLSVIGLVLCVIFGFMLVCNITIIIKGTLFPEKPPSVLGTTPMVVLSGSMSGEAEDHIEIGDLIFVGRTEPEKLKEGDIIAFMEGTVVVTHRIVEVQVDENQNYSFITKGDANNAQDVSPVMADNLVGIYKTRIPKVGNFALFLQTPLGMMIFVGVPLLGFIIYDIFRRQKYVNKERQRRMELEADLKRLQGLMGKEAMQNLQDSAGEGETK